MEVYRNELTLLIPGPVSVTSNRKYGGVKEQGGSGPLAVPETESTSRLTAARITVAVTVMRPPFGVNLRALDRRFRTT